MESVERSNGGRRSLYYYNGSEIMHKDWYLNVSFYLTEDDNPEPISPFI